MTTKAERYLQFNDWMQTQLQSPQEVGHFLAACIEEDNLGSGLCQVIRANGTETKAYLAMMSLGLMVERLSAEELQQVIEFTEATWPKSIVLFYRQTLEDLKGIQKVLEEGGSIQLEGIESSKEMRQEHPEEYNTLKQAIAS